MSFKVIRMLLVCSKYQVFCSICTIIEVILELAMQRLSTFMPQNHVKYFLPKFWRIYFVHFGGQTFCRYVHIMITGNYYNYAKLGGNVPLSEDRNYFFPHYFLKLLNIQF